MTGVCGQALPQKGSVPAFPIGFVSCLIWIWSTMCPGALQFDFYSPSWYCQVVLDPHSSCGWLSP